MLIEQLESRQFFTVGSPTSLSASAASSTAILLKWNDTSSKETGFSVQRSTDGKTFSEINKVGANVESYTNGRLTTGKKYYYRVRAFTSSETSNYTNVASATPVAGASIPSAPSATTTTSSTGHSWANGGVGEYATGKWAYDGVSITGGAKPDANIISQLKKLHVGSIRTWFPHSSWTDLSAAKWAIKTAAAYKAAGFRVMLQIDAVQVPSYATAKSFFQKVLNYPGFKGSFDLLQIGNEPNREPFWKGTASQYVNQVLKPAYEVFHPAGIKVVGAGPTWDVAYCQTLAKAGYTKYCDIANFHPYGSSADQVLQRAQGAKAAFGNMPILFSEWNIRNATSNADWAKKIDQARKALVKVGAVGAFYYSLVTHNSMAGPAGLLTSSFTPHSPFYGTFKGWGE